MAKSHRSKNKSGQGRGFPSGPARGGFATLVIAAIVLIGLSALLWFMTPWSRPGHTHMQVEDGTMSTVNAAAVTGGTAAITEIVGVPEAGFVQTADGRVIPINEDLPERIITIERDDEEIARFTAEITDTPRSQEVGLMGRTELAPDRGMLFTWEPPNIIAMWMKDTLIPLDFLYVRRGGVIVAIGHSVPPCPPETTRCPAYAAPEPVLHVLEIAGGRAKELDLRPGDRLVIHDSVE